MDNHRKRNILIALCDLALLAGAVPLRRLSEWMLTRESDCLWARLGGQCLTCGGTHFVRDLLSGRVVDAFWDNPYLFILTVFFALTLVLLNLSCLLGWRWAGRLLSRLYCFPVLIAFCAGLFVFLFVRNLPLLTRLAEGILARIG